MNMNEFNEWLESVKAKLQAHPELRQHPGFIALRSEILEDWKRSVDTRFREMRGVLHDGCTALNVVLSSIDPIQKKTGEQDYEAKQAIVEMAPPLKQLLSELMNRLKTLGVLP
jgi:hypothetical protein